MCMHVHNVRCTTVRVLHCITESQDQEYIGLNSVTPIGTVYIQLQEMEIHKHLNESEHILLSLSTVQKFNLIT